jgi:hypothetical protein
VVARARGGPRHHRRAPAGAAPHNAAAAGHCTAFRTLHPD